MNRIGKKTGYIFMAVTLLFLLASCGIATESHRAEAESGLTALLEARAHAEETYDLLYDDALFSRLTEAGQRTGALAEKDLSAMSDQEIDETFLPEVRELIKTYAGLQELLDQTAAMEEEERSELAGRRLFSFHVVNKSGESFSGLTWKYGKGSWLTTCLTQTSSLANGAALAGMSISVPVTDDDAALRIEAQTDGGETRTYVIGGSADLEDHMTYYVVLLPEGQKLLTTDPAEISG